MCLVKCKQFVIESGESLNRWLGAINLREAGV